MNESFLHHQVSDLLAFFALDHNPPFNAASTSEEVRDSNPATPKMTLV